MHRSAFIEEADGAARLAIVVGVLVVARLLLELLGRWWNPTTDAFVAVPVFSALAVVGAMLAVFVLVVRVRLIDSGRLRWVIAGITVAGVAAMFQGVAVSRLTAVPELATPSGEAALGLLWRAALGLFALGGALAPDRRHLRRAAVAVSLLALAVILFEPAWELLPALIDRAGRLTTAYRTAGAVVVALVAVGGAAWVIRCGRRPTWPEAWIAVVLVLAAVDGVTLLAARTWMEAVWWSSAWLRAAQFVVPAAGLLADNARLLGLLRRHERSLAEQLDLELEAALDSTGRSAPEPGAEERIAAVLDTGAYRPVFQPIISLDDGAVLAVEALTRFTLDPVRTPDRWFAEAHAVGRGIELELATLGAALEAARALPPTVAVSVNVSPATLIHRSLIALVDERRGGRPLTVELTEHEIIEDYSSVDVALAELRRRGVRIAIDDAGAGFASLRHVVRIGPDVLKLDMSLTRDVHLDPVRRALADSLVHFARRTGTTMVAEGVEQGAELAVLAELGVHAAQGYLLCEPIPVEELAGRIDALSLERLPVEVGTER